LGEESELNGPVVLCPYDPKWPALFETEAAKVSGALGEAALAVHHVGSTSVPGLCAKPIIDMVLEVADSADEGGYVPALEAAAYVFRIREPDWFEHRLLKGGAPSVNLHVFSRGSPEIARMLAFRDRLRANAAERELYEQTKRALAARRWRITQDYADAKTEVVQSILARSAPK
jgi:GrpB-like predicted nucleotidyltransferase (UPF0157 family)